MDDLVRYSILVTFLQRLEKVWKGQYFGMTIVQKLMYFFTQAWQANLPDYSFKFYHYGPYCDQLDTDLRILSAGGVIAIESDGEGLGVKISTKDVNPLRLDLSKEFWNSHSSSFEDMCSVFGFRKPQDFELLATIHYVYQALCRNEEVDVVHIVARVKSLKPKFDEQRIRTEYDFLAGKRLLTCT